MSGSGLNPHDCHELFDAIIFGGVRSPGVIVAMSGFEREENLDVKESDGQKGAATTWKGTKCGAGSITWYLVKTDDGVDDFAEWDTFQDIIDSTVPPLSGKKPVAKDFYHPDAARQSPPYTSLIKRKVGKLQHDGKGGALVTVDFSEYYPPKPAAAGGASGSKPKTDPNDPVSKASAELDELLKQASAA